MRKLPRKIKNTWNALSFTRRKQLKVSAVSFGAILGGTTLAVTASPLLAGLGLVTALLGVARGSAGLLGLKDEIRHGQEKVLWQNTAGQTIESTRVQQRDLERYAEIMHPTHRVPGGYTLVGRHSLKMIRFNAVAKNVTVVKDITGHDSAYYRFSKPVAPPKFHSLLD